MAAAASPQTRYLVSIQVETPQKLWNRTVVSPFLPHVDDFKYYYTTLLGFKDATVTVQSEEVSATFNDTLLEIANRAPTHYPQHDLETTHEQDDRRKAYTNFIKQLCDMEKSRESLRMYMNEKPMSAAVDDQDEDGDLTEEYVTSGMFRSRKWVNELLRTLNTEFDYEDSFDDAKDSLMPVYSDEYVPPGWIFTPTAESVRNSRGSRIVINSEIGKKWEKMLGSDLFPDMVVARRISSISWAFQHPTCDTLVKAMLDWYIATQDAKFTDGISDWIPNAEKEMNYLFSTFRRIKVNERLIMEALPSVNSKQNSVFKILNTVESRLLSNPTEISTIVPISYDMFSSYINYLFKAMNVDKDLYQNNESVRQILTRWANSRMGFRGDAEPLLSNWVGMWNTIMRGHVTAERLSVFLRSMASWDNYEAAAMSTPQKQALCNEWINMYIDAEIVPDEKSKILSTVAHTRCKDWCLQYLPEVCFPTNFTPMTIGPMFNRRGYIPIKGKNGRLIHGLRFRTAEPFAFGSEIDVEKEKPAKVAKVRSSKTVNVVTATADDRVAEQHSVTQTTRATTEDGAFIEHFFSSTVTTQEINLGSL
jgi:hypothetical protein